MTVRVYIHCKVNIFDTERPCLKFTLYINIHLTLRGPRLLISGSLNASTRGLVAIVIPLHRAILVIFLLPCPELSPALIFGVVIIALDFDLLAYIINVTFLSVTHRIRGDLVYR
jgi:hypothetical protein